MYRQKDTCTVLQELAVRIYSAVTVITWNRRAPTVHIAASHALDLVGVSGPLQASNEQSFNDVCLNPLGTSLQRLIQVGFVFFFFFPFSFSLSLNMF